MWRCLDCQLKEKGQQGLLAAPGAGSSVFIPATQPGWLPASPSWGQWASGGAEAEPALLLPTPVLPGTLFLPVRPFLSPWHDICPSYFSGTCPVCCPLQTELPPAPMSELHLCSTHGCLWVCYTHLLRSLLSTTTSFPPLLNGSPSRKPSKPRCIVVTICHCFAPWFSPPCAVFLLDLIHQRDLGALQLIFREFSYL